MARVTAEPKPRCVAINGRGETCDLPETALEHRGAPGSGSFHPLTDHAYVAPKEGT